MTDAHAADRAHRAARAPAALAGLVAAALALGTTELVSGLRASTPGPIASVGRQIIENAPGSMERWAIDTFGTGDKPALLAAIVVVCLLLGAGVGVLALRARSAAVIAFAAFAVLGTLAARADPLVPESLALAAPGVAALVGVAALWFLLHLHEQAEGTTPPAAPSTTSERLSSIVLDSPIDPRATRRAFFGYAGGATAAAVGASVLGRSLRARSSVEEARALVELPEGAGQLSQMPDASFEAIDGLTAHLTPNDDFYLIDTALVKPQVDPETWRLSITGMVDNELSFTFDDLLAMDLVDEEITMACVSNEVGGNLIGNAVWTGVPLLGLLEQAGIGEGATQVASRSVDGWTCGFPTELLSDGRPALLVVGMNGEPLPIRHGFPARVVVGGLYGYVSATKWVQEITLTTWEGFDGYWMSRGWSKEGPVKTQCRIDVPRRGRELLPGPTPIAGVAWAMVRGISKVEVQVDGGEWVEATLSDVGSDPTWRQWVLEWDAVPGDHTIVARATDGDGVTQTEEVSRPDPDGATGYPLRIARVADA